MAIISKSGIGTGNTIQAEHITRIIDALNGTGSAEVVATGSFTGSFNGSADIWTVQDLTVFGTASINYFETIYETSSIIYQSGSTKFGNSADDTHQFTGSVFIDGDTQILGNTTATGSFSGSFVGDGSGLDGVVATTLFALSEGSGISAFTFDGSSTQTINISGSVGLTTDTVTKWTGAAFADTSITDNGAVVDINSDTVITGSLTINQTSISSSLESPIIEVKIDDASSRLFISNNTSINGRFVPRVGGAQEDDNLSPGLFVDGVVLDTLDTTTTPALIFRAIRLDTGVVSEIVNRNLFQWRNLNSTKMAMDVDGNLGIGTTTPNYKLDVNGTTNINGNTNITGSVDVANGNINLEDNAFFLQGTSNVGNNVSLIGVDSSNRVYIGNLGYPNILAGYTGISGSLDVSGSLNVTDGITGSFAGSFVGDGTGSFTGSFVGDGAGLYNIPASGITGLNLSQIASGSATASIAPNTGFRVNTDSAFTGSMTISGSASPALSVIGSGSAVFTVNGSVGEIFSVSDSLSGSLFAVNDASGFPIFEVFSDETINYGSNLAPALTTTVKNTVSSAGVFTVYSLPTASYDGAWFEYVAKSGSDARAGQIMSLWSGTAVNFTETTTTDFGDTSGLSFTVAVSGSNFALTGSVATAGWTIKTIVRSI